MSSFIPVLFNFKSDDYHLLKVKKSKDKSELSCLGIKINAKQESMIFTALVFVKW